MRPAGKGPLESLYFDYRRRLALVLAHELGDIAAFKSVIKAALDGPE